MAHTLSHILTQITSTQTTIQWQSDDTPEMYAKLEGRAAAVLRNLAHDLRQRPLLVQSGAVDVLASIMRRNKVGQRKGGDGARAPEPGP